MAFAHLRAGREHRAQVDADLLLPGQAQRDCREPAVLLSGRAAGRMGSGAGKARGCMLTISAIVGYRVAKPHSLASRSRCQVLFLLIKLVPSALHPFLSSPSPTADKNVAC